MNGKGKVLHVLSQRPQLTGSGVTLDAFVRRAGERGWAQEVVVGTPAEAPQPEVGGLPASRVHPLVFGAGRLDFPLPGMSDVMPYPSSRFSALTPAQLGAYEASWKEHLAGVIERTRPDLIHSHHVWLMSSWLKDVAPGIPVVTQCHATGLRQMGLASHLAGGVKERVARNERFCVLHSGHAEDLVRTLGVAPDRVMEVGAGYNDRLFHRRGKAREGTRLLYVGKLSAAKGLPWLLDAVMRLRDAGRELELHVAGAGAGPEAEALKQRLVALAPLVSYHGQLDQAALAELMGRAAVCVLPSFYEGVPLVLVEALACGCRLVSTRLPGVVTHLEPHLGPALDTVPLPRLVGSDVPEPTDLPAFVDALVAALDRALGEPPLDVGADWIDEALAPFSWSAVFERVEGVWKGLLSGFEDGS